MGTVSHFILVDSAPSKGPETVSKPLANVFMLETVGVAGETRHRSRWEHRGSVAHGHRVLPVSWLPWRKASICTQLHAWALLRPCNGMCAAGRGSTRTRPPFHCQYPAFVCCKCPGQAQEREPRGKRVLACRGETCPPAGENTWLENDISKAHVCVKECL